jgi:hypothetical protein
LKTFFGVGMVGVPQLASDEEFFTWHTTVPDTLSNLMLVAVDPDMYQQ